MTAPAPDPMDPAERVLWQLLCDGAVYLDSHTVCVDGDYRMTLPPDLVDYMCCLHESFTEVEAALLARLDRGIDQSGSNMKGSPSVVEPEYDPVEWMEDDGWHALQAVASCSICGAVVAVDVHDVHTAWHQRIDRTRMVP